MTHSMTYSPPCQIQPTLRPRHHTPRSKRPTAGPAIAKIQAALGQKPMPWQQKLYDVAGEIDSAGLLWYRTVIVRVQRRAGKTAALAAFATWRALTTPSARLWYTAQTGRYASEWMRDEYMLALAAGPFGDGINPKSKYKASKRAGAETVKWAHNGALFSVFAPTENAMHGKYADTVFVDEAWAFDSDQGSMLRQAIRPTLLTRPGSQLWIVSAGGHADSDYLHDYCALGLDSLKTPDSRVAYIDYGIPEDSDPFDLENIALHHPAYGHTFGWDALSDAKNDFVNDPAGFARAYGTVDTAARASAIPPALWDAAGTRPRPVDPPVRAGIAYDISTDGRNWALAAAWGPDDDGLTWIELIDAGPTPPDAASQVAAAATTFAAGPDGTATATCDSISAAAQTLADRITETYPRVKIQQAGVTHLADAVNLLNNGLADRTLAHSHQPHLDDAAAGASARTIRDGHTIWSRAASSHPISPLIAAALALRNHHHQPPPPRRPLLVI